MRGAKVAVYAALALAVVPLLSPTLRADTITLEITAWIDGRDMLIVQGNTLQWAHLDFAAVGRLGGANLPTTISTTENGTPVMESFQWTPDWPFPPPDEIRFEALSSVFTDLTPALPSTGVTAALTVIQARGSVGLLQGPTDGNGNTLILDFNDDPPGGAAFYTAELTICTDSTCVLPPPPPPGQIPEPCTLGLLCTGVTAIAVARGRRQRTVK